MTTPELGDNELLRRFGAGDAAAFDSLYERHRQGLYAYLLGMLADAEAAADALQAVFADVCRHVERYAGAENVRAYLFGAAARQAARVRRDHSREHAKRERLAQHVRFAPRESSVGSEAFARRLTMAVAALEAQERELVMLHLFEGFTFEQLERLLGVSGSTLYKRYQRTLQRLKEALGEQS